MLKDPMTTSPFLTRLEQPKPLLADGAMGTLLHSRGNDPLDTCFEYLCVSHPQRVADVHREYVQAGAELIKTNTFGANRYRLAEYGLGDAVEAVNRQAVKLARWATALHEGVFVVASVSSLGVPMKPFGKLEREQVYHAFHEQLSVLISEGIDALLLETFTDHNELLVALAVARELQPDLPIVAQMTFNADSRTRLGYLPGRVAREIHQAGADVIGVNCSGGPSHIANILKLMRQSVPEARFSAMPNAGYPEQIGGRTIYPSSADYFGQTATTLQQLGACIVGGCCGTSPSHIASMRLALDKVDTPSIDLILSEALPSEAPTATEHQPTELQTRLLNRQFTITVEMTPPRGYEFEHLLKAGDLLRSAGADLLDINDSPAAKMRMSPWALCQLLQTQVGLETILHFPTRGRNLLRVQGDLLGAHALGLRNLFVTMGDPTKIGDYPDATDSFDIAPSKLMDVIAHNFNQGTDLGGNSIGKPTHFTVGCALNMFADDLNRELDLLERKIEGGAVFALGQPVFEAHKVEEFLQAYEARFNKTFDFPVLMGIMPLFSLKQARFLHNEVPGISIPPSIFARLEQAGETAPQVGVQIAVELAQAVKPLVAGAYIIPAFGKHELAAQVVNAIR